MAEITALVTFHGPLQPIEPGPLAAGSLASHLDASARLLTQEERQAWIRAHLDALAQLSDRAGIDLSSLRSDAPVLALGPLPPAEQILHDEGRTPAGRGLRIEIAHAPEGSPSPERQQALRRAILAFLSGMPGWRAPLLVEARVDASAHSSDSLSSVEPIDLRLVPPSQLPLHVRRLGEIRLSADGHYWLAPARVSDDDSRLRVFAAQIYEAADIRVAPTRLFQDEHGGLRAAHRLPPNLSEERFPWTHPTTEESIIAGIAVDAFLWNADLGRYPFQFFAIDGHQAVRLHMAEPASTMSRIGRPGGRSIHAAAVPDELANLLHPAHHSIGLLRGTMEKASLADLGASVQRVLSIDDDLLRRLTDDLRLEDRAIGAAALATLQARRNAMGGLSFMQRLGQDFYERGTSPEHIRGIVLWRLATESFNALTGRRPMFGTVPIRARAEPATPTLRSPHEVPDDVAEAVLDLLKDGRYLERPVARGGTRLVYPIPGHPFLFKLERRAAEGIVQWRERHGGGAIPDWVLSRGFSYADRLNQRYAQMVVHMGPDRVYPERSFIVPECDVPGHLLSELDQASRARRYRLPILGSIQRVFPYIGMPGVLEYHVPYAERKIAQPPLPHQYKAALERWVLLRTPTPGLSRSPTAEFMAIHASSTAEQFLQRCVENESLRKEAGDYFVALLNRYCPATGESVDTAGEGNGCWYPDEQGRYRLAALDYLYPGDEPIVFDAPVSMTKFLRGEPLTISEKAGLLNAINFARGANFMAFQLGAPAELDLFPDELMKAHISSRFWDLFQMLHTIRFELRETHPDRPWGFF